MEEEPVPSDATIVDYTWTKVNKDGSPDRRFRDNYQIPIFLYGDHVKAKAFAEAFYEYQGNVYTPCP